MRFGAVVVLLQCLAMFGYAAWLVAATFTGSANDVQSDSGAAQYVNIGTAVFLAIVFGFVAWAAIGALRGTPRSVGAIVLVEAILCGVAIYMFQGGAVTLGIVTVGSAVLALVGVFHPQSREYNETRYEQRKASRV